MTMRKFLSKRLYSIRHVNNNNHDNLKEEESNARMQRILEKNQSILAMLEKEEIFNKDDTNRTTSTEKDEQEEVEIRRMTTRQSRDDESNEEDEADSDSVEVVDASDDSIMARATHSPSFAVSGLPTVFDQKMMAMTAGVDTPSDQSVTSSNGRRSGTSSNRSVSFDKLTIRRFSTTIIENPSVSAGPAITLAWDLSAPSEEWTVEDYEAVCPSQERPVVKALSSHDRHELLLNNGLTATAIRQAVGRTNKLRKQRSQTARKFQVKNGGGKVARLLRVKEQMRRTDRSRAEIDRDTCGMSRR